MAYEAKVFDSYNQTMHDVSYPLRVGLGSGNGDEIPKVLTPTMAYGFYSNEGPHGMGDNANVSPSVKIGSGLGIPSPPAVAFNVFPGRPGENTPATLRAIETDIAHSVTVTEHEKSTDRGTRVVEPGRSVVRRLTPVECCRLQGFPDDWNSEGITKEGKRIQMADAPRYRQLGNAVTVNVANWIANNLAQAYSECGQK